jgi:hypothetical protein
VARADGVGAAALVRLPHTVTLRASYSKRSHRYLLRGSVTESGVGLRHASVRLFIGTRSHALHSFARVITDQQGRFSYSGKLSAKRPVRFKATARAADRVISRPHCAALNVAMPHRDREPLGERLANNCDPTLNSRRRRTTFAGAFAHAGGTSFPLVLAPRGDRAEQPLQSPKLAEQRSAVATTRP